MSVTSAAYNRLVDLAGRLYPVRFVHQPLDPASGTHPWQISLKSDENARIGLCLYPGLVNGLPAYINLPFRQVS